MRKEFFQMLQEEMRKDEKLFLLMGDTGYNLLEPFFEEFPPVLNGSINNDNSSILSQQLHGVVIGFKHLLIENPVFNINLINSSLSLFNK